ncbi:sensor histidine kinase [Tsukamurella pseudospumae]|uniref:sensor histidine kinase n=1 Tax=Tsukamurella pseudospumae TaxID=239498 RepID=UPI000A9F38A3|nr:ATP-binding protein [Tsukamurella pseudospumae]
MIRVLRPVRSRLTLTATALVTVALVIAGAVMVLVLHRVLLDSADNTNTARATDIAAALAESGPDGIDDGLLSPGQNIDLIQILDSEGRVLRSSRSHPGGALGGVVPAGARTVLDGATAAPSDAEYRATRVGVRTAAGDFTVEVGTAESALNRLVLLVAGLCAAVFPVVVAAMAWLTHVFVGRALSPVERIRSQVAEISDADLAERVPVPATGDEVETLARTMNAMLGRLETAQTTQRRFVADASHELNSPLTSIFGLLDLADQTDEPVDVDTVRTLLLPEADRMRGLIADLALLARADESGAPVPRTDVDLARLVADEAERLRALGRHGIDVSTVPAIVRGDPGQLARVVRNLTDNAARYARTRLTLTMTADGGTVTVAVTDDGPGIPEADRHRVFERFVRLDAARSRSSGGSGLGLAIVAEIVRAHDGTYGVDVDGRGGTRFWFTLPTT